MCIVGTSSAIRTILSTLENVVSFVEEVFYVPNDPCFFSFNGFIST
jgi:hypothetical protein